MFGFANSYLTNGHLARDFLCLVVRLLLILFSVTIVAEMAATWMGDLAKFLLAFYTLAVIQTSVNIIYVNCLF